MGLGYKKPTKKRVVTKKPSARAQTESNKATYKADEQKARAQGWRKVDGKYVKSTSKTYNDSKRASATSARDKAKAGKMETTGTKAKAAKPVARRVVKAKPKKRPNKKRRG
jgi:hypothetical protein